MELLRRFNFPVTEMIITTTEFVVYKKSDIAKRKF